MSRPNRSDLLFQRTCGIVLGVTVITVLYFARDIFLPLTLAILLTFLLSSTVTRLERRGVHKIAAVVGVLCVVAGAIFLIGMIVGRQIVGFAEDLPSYRKNIAAKVQTVNGWAGGLKQAFGWIDDMKNLSGTEERAEVMDAVRQDSQKSNRTSLENLKNNSESASDEKIASKDNSGERKPIAVEVVNNGFQPWEIASEWLGPLLSPISLIGLVALFTVFMLLERHDLRNRLVVLLGDQRLFATTQILDEAGDKVSKYLRAQLLINVIHGTIVAIALSIIGLPNAILWGFLGAILRFLPYLGPLLATIMPICISLAVFEGWMQPLAVLGMYVVIELLSNNVLEPWLYGSNTGLSPLGIMVSALFWTWLWGTPGLILATPITACVTVIGRHFPQFRFLNVLLSDQPPLPPAAVIYQRLLARDQEQAGDTIDSYLKEHGVEQLYDEVVLPTIRMAEIDRHQGMMNGEESAAMKQDLRTFVAEVGEDIEDYPAEKQTVPTAKILCVSAGDEGDELAGQLITQLLQRAGHDVELLGARTLAGEVLSKYTSGDYDMVLISALPPSATMHTRYLCKRLQGVGKSGRILIGYWTNDAYTEKLEQRFRSRGAAKVATRFKDALQWIKQEAPGWASERKLRGSANTPDTVIKRIDPAVVAPS